MKIARLLAFVEEVRRDATAHSIADLACYYRFQDKWFTEIGEDIRDEALRSDLQLTLVTGSHWRPRKSRSSYFPISSLDAVIVATFAAPPRKPRRESFANALARCLKHSNDAYNADHHPLTWLYNKKKLEELLRDMLAQGLPGVASTPQAAEEIGPIASLTVLAFDLDHFKQVNDQFGHRYGDLVLRTFALRLEECARELARTYHPRGNIYLAHPSGEEFVAIVRGTVSDEELENIGEAFRETIAKVPFPTEPEIKQSELGSFDVPHASLRRVTTSIGMASASLGTTAPHDGGQVALLLEHADIALYSAKAGGRNAVRKFSDILTKYGRVLAHHQDMDYVVIDIGKKVNVKRGQEFLVFHPDFTGEVAYVYRDGRTEKTLGRYPRRHCARIVAFDVQTDISFCEVVDRQHAGLKFPPGCMLQAIPLGSITHLIAAPPEFDFKGSLAPHILSATQLPRLVEDIVSREKNIFVAVFKVKDQAAVSESRGSAFVNHALGDLYAVIREEFPADASVGHVELTEYAVVAELRQEHTLDKSVSRVLLRASANSNNQVKFIAGVCYPVEGPRERGDSSNILFQRALDLARYAVSDQGFEGSSDIETFTVRTAYRVVMKWKDARDYAKGLADYQRFSEAGLSFAPLHNQAGLCALYSSDLELATRCFAGAVLLDAANPLFLANLALVQVRTTTGQTAFETFNRSLTAEEGFELPDVYKAAFAMASYHAHKDNPDNVDKNVVLSRLTEAIPSSSGLLVSPLELVRARADLYQLASNGLDAHAE